jgi:hypothetical protein
MGLDSGAQSHPLWRARINDLAGLADTSHYRGSTQRRGFGQIVAIGQRAVGDHLDDRVDSVGPDFECVTPVNSLWNRRRSATRPMRSGVSHIAPILADGECAPLMSPSTPLSNSEHREARQKKFVQQYTHGTCGRDNVVENIDSINLCLSLFAVHLEMRDLST